MSLPDPDLQPDFYAGILAKRLLAWVIDMVLVIVMALLVVPFTAFTGLFFFPLLVAVIGFVYRVMTLSAGSATWGMRFVGVELRTARGERFDGSAAMLHTIGYTVSLAAAPLQLISIAMMMISDRRQGLTDHVLGTAMVNRRAAAWLG